MSGPGEEAAVGVFLAAVVVAAEGAAVALGLVELLVFVPVPVLVLVLVSGVASLVSASSPEISFTKFCGNNPT
jgi:hypothetical protein